MRTREMKELITDESRAFSERAPDQVFLDLSLLYTKNKKNYSSTWAFQLKNVLGSKTLYYYDYDYSSDEVITVEEAIVLPSLSYKIEF